MNKNSILCVFLISLVFSFLFCSCDRLNNNKKETNKTGPLSWEIKDQTLIISGEGPMKNFFQNGPWGERARESFYSIIINEGVTYIGDYAFAGSHKDVVSIFIPSTVTYIGENAFKGCSSLTSIIIPDNVISIEKSAFESCVKLRNVELGKNVLFIGSNAFLGCSSILSVICKNPVPPILEPSVKPSYKDPNETLNAFYNNGSRPSDILRQGQLPWESELNEKYGYVSEGSNEANLKTTLVNAFYSVPDNCRFIVPDEAISAYKEDKQWGRFFK